MIRAKKMRILIVEDDEAGADHLQRIVAQFGYEVSAIVMTGEEAVDQVQRNTPDLVLMDVTLNAGMDGIQAAEKIRSFNQVPVVYITGRVDIEQWQRAKITEPFGYILKPFENRELDVVIAAAMYKSCKEQEILAANNRCAHYLDRLGGIVFHSGFDMKPFSVQGPVEKIMGYKAEEIISGHLPIDTLVHPDEQPLLSAEDREKLKVLPGFSIDKESRIVTRDNQVRWMRKTVKNITGSAGEPVSIECIMYDITDYKNLENNLKDINGQLVHLEKLASIGQLTAGVAHEINNPVGYISNNVDVLRQYINGYTDLLKIVDNLKKSIEQNNAEKTKSLIEEMAKFEEEINLDFIVNDTDRLLQHTQRGIERIQKIVIGLRTFARQENELTELTDVEEVLESILPIISNELKYKAELKKEYGKLPLIKCHSRELGQVFINLLTNAAQAIKERGEIRIKTYLNADHACISITDTGCGIAPENRKKIFTPFFTTKEIGKGTGLGLSISYDIIKRHNGDIRVDSTDEHGTTFTVQLPVNT